MSTSNRYFLNVYFYGIDQCMNGDRARENIINRTVSYLDPPFCHCELQFMNGESLAVYANTKVTMKKRTFEDPQYCYLCLPCTRQQYDSVYTCASAMVGLPFSWLALINCKLRLWSGSTKATFCSKLCCDVLYAGKCLHTSNMSNYITPSMLHAIISEELQHRKLRQQQATDAVDFAMHKTPNTDLPWTAVKAQYTI